MMRKAIFLLLIIVALSSCSKSESQYENEINQAEFLLPENPDSVSVVLETIAPSDIKSDSLMAKLQYLKAYCHLLCNRSMIGDSLISFAYDYYRGKDIVKDIRCGTALAYYKYWMGDTSGSIAMLDSLARLSNVPDSLLTLVLRTRVSIGATEYQGREIIPFAKRLQKLEDDTLRKVEAKYMLIEAYEYASEIDSALNLLDELIDYAGNYHLGDKQFIFMVEKAQLLTENGREDESDRLINEIFSKAGPDNGAADMLHFQFAINALNRGDVIQAKRHLSVADSLAVRLRGDDDTDFRSYSNLLHSMIDFKQSGRIKLMHINGLNNRRSEQFNRMRMSQWKLERDALHQQNYALNLKAESEHKTVIILIVGIAALLILGGSIWIIKIRHQRERDNEERIEALQRMVDEYKSAHTQENKKCDSAVRSVMFKHLGIIKMVAETPTEQNCDMLRKISAIDGENNGELVDWKTIYELIDNIYSGFYSNLHGRYGNTLIPKEEQIIILMVAGFSTKEISVITGQTTSTIYVRKSSIRKKIGVPEKEDIVEFLRTPGEN